MTVQSRSYSTLKAHGIPIDDLLAVSKLWIEAREKGFFTPEKKARLRDTSVRHELSLDAKGTYELRELPL